MNQCESCGMPIENGLYCQHCVDAEGRLQSFEERLQRMVQWIGREQPDLPREKAESQALAHMARMPAWRDDPRVRGRG